MWGNLLEKLLDFLNKYDPKRTFNFGNEILEKKFNELREQFVETFVYEVLGEEKLQEAYFFVRKLTLVCEEVKRLYNLSEIVWSRELRRFIKDPLRHLKHVLRFYVFDVLRRHITKEEFWDRGAAAVRTAFRTNERACYERWVLLEILKQLKIRENARIIYPEIGALVLTRAGKQKLAIIPPDIIVELQNLSDLSFFLEAPRPITWGDTQELKFVWSLYRIARPDILVYADKIFNILDLSKEPPIKNPDVVIEIKFLENWWKRKRLLRIFSKPLTIEHWRSLWIQGLYEGLSEILGIRKPKTEELKPQKGAYATDLQVLKMYLEIFNPKMLFCVSMVPVPNSIKEELESYNTIIVDDVSFNEKKLEIITDHLIHLAKSTKSSPLSTLMSHVRSKGFSLSESDLLSFAIQFALMYKNEFLDFLRRKILKREQKQKVLLSYKRA